jgi:hypothetical protein
LAPKNRLLRKTWFQNRFEYNTIMTTKTILSEKLVNMKVVENVIRFPESTRTQISEFVYGIYDQNTELDRDKLLQNEIT